MESSGLIRSGDEKGFPSAEHAPLDGNNKSFNADRQHSRLVYYKNLLVLCLGFYLTFTAFLAIQNLQSSINHESGLGVASLACVYGGVILSCCYSPAVISHIGSKWAIVIGLIGQLLFTLSNFYPRFYTLVTGSLLFGLGNGPMWTGQGVYLTRLALDYAKAFDVPSEHVISKFNGFFFTFFQLAQITGSLISSLVLFNKQDSVKELEIDFISNFTNRYSINTSDVDYSINSHQCGSNFCSFSNLNKNDQIVPPKHLVLILIGIYSACALMAVLIFAIFADDRDAVRQKALPFDEKNKRQQMEKTSELGSVLLATIKAHKKLTLLLVLPTFLWSGIEQGFMFGEYTQSFLSCPFGLQLVGYAMVGYGAMDALFCLLSGGVQRVTGRIVIFIAGFIINMVLLLVMLLWTPSMGYIILYIMPAIWGIGDAVWNASVSALIGVVFVKHQEVAFSAFRLWQAFGMCLMFTISSFLCMKMKIFIALALCTFAAVNYTIMEVKVKKIERKKQLKDITLTT